MKHVPLDRHQAVSVLPIPGLGAGGAIRSRATPFAMADRRAFGILPSLRQLYARSARKAGNAARDRKDWAAAAAAYRRYLAFQPDSFAIRVQLGHMMKESGDIAGAAAVYAAALRLRPHDADLLIWIGDLHRREGRYDAALDAFRASLASDGNGIALREIARTEDMISEQEAAAAAIETPESTPETPPPSRLVGHIDSLNGNRLTGWAVDPDHPGTAVDIEFLVGERVVGRARAETRREDLATIGGFGFRAQIDTGTLAEHDLIDARLTRTGEALRDTPFCIERRAVATEAPLAASVRFEVVKPLTFTAGQELALFVTHSRTGAIKPHVLPHIRALAAEGIATLLIVVADRPADIADDIVETVAGAIVRENRGYDFACWSHALRIYPQAYAASVLYLLNDSVYGPADADRFARMIARVRVSEADLVGLTESHEHRWHVQSYFLALKPRLLSWMPFHGFIDDVRILDRKDDVIQSYEIALAPLIEQSGLKVEVLFPNHAVRNPTLFGWRDLLDAGFPYVKLLLLRGEFPMIDLEGWRDVVARHGFDTALLDATLATGTEGWAPSSGHALLARPWRRPGREVRPLKVAFFGPWNYDNGLGAASRGLIAAIRRCDVEMNLYPIEKPFHIHKALTPPVPVTDFVGPADIAVVHLNPDSWFLLTDAQRAMIAAAGKKIGHWVWEMGHIPPAWRHDFSSVDRIWAPSGYCADLFANEGEAPVDIVPYTVPLPETHVSDERKTRLRATLGVPARNRVILYAFDGSSYLIRKNPTALVRAFSSSGLAKAGWSLVLKTKHLFDRPAEGRALETLVAGTSGVVLINASMSAADMADLSALCDIYASTHCSEGFGLTIAEAMAAGKPVVATDFGGSTQFLDASCGYPVRADAWTLEDDFGHYTKGGQWARIDETALADALRQAAQAIERGDTRIGEAARARVADSLSYEAIGALIARSFRSVVEDELPVHHPSPRIKADLSSGVRFDRVELGAHLIPVALASDLTPPDPATLRDLPDDRAHWIVFAPHDAYLAPLFERIVTEFVERRPDVDIAYGDDIACFAARSGDELRLKPAFDVTLLAAQDYIGAPLIVRASAFARLGGFDRRAGAAGLSDLLFRAHALGMSICPIQQTLLGWDGSRPTVSRETRRAMLRRLPAFAAHDIVDGRMEETLEVRRRFDGADIPAVTIVIPTRRSPLPTGDGSYIARLLQRLGDTDWPMDRLHVLVGDDVEGNSDWATASYPFGFTRLATPRAAGTSFNYSAKMNQLWRASRTEHMVLMNDDVLPAGPGWLKALMTFAMDESVGGVGARLLYDNGRLQHAGMAPLFGLVAHPWLGGAAGAAGYQGWAQVQREWSAVTGAVFATRRSMLEQIDGFEERFTLEYNDVDLCLRMRALGYRIVFTPHAELTHSEKASRGEALPPGADLALFRERWRQWLRQDPSFHPGLHGDRLTIEPRHDPEAWYA